MCVCVFREGLERIRKGEGEVPVGKGLGGGKQKVSSCRIRGEEENLTTQRGVT